MNKRLKKPHYYMDMPHSPIATQVEGPTNIITLVVDIEDLSMQEEGK
jgi:hypothetical protein